MRPWSGYLNPELKACVLLRLAFLVADREPTFDQLATLKGQKGQDDVNTKCLYNSDVKIIISWMEVIISFKSLWDFLKGRFHAFFC